MVERLKTDKTKLLPRHVVKQNMARKDTSNASSVSIDSAVYSSDDKSSDSDYTPSSNSDYSDGFIPRCGDENNLACIKTLRSWYNTLKKKHGLVDDRRSSIERQCHLENYLLMGSCRMWLLQQRELSVDLAVKGFEYISLRNRSSCHDLTPGLFGAFYASSAKQYRNYEVNIVLSIVEVITL